MPRRDRDEDNAPPVGRWERDRERPDDDGGRPEPPHVPVSNPAAGVSLALGVLSIALNLIAGIPAIVFGVIALKHAGRRGPGRKMAGAGIACAVVGSALSGVAIYDYFFLRSLRKDERVAHGNLKQLGRGLSAYHDANRSFPQAYLGIHPPELGDGPLPLEQRLQSWRVGLLPHLDQPTLFHQYVRGKPWNSPENRAVTKSVVPEYVSTVEPSNQTRFRVFTGPNTPFRHGRPPYNANVMTDGISNTVLVAESAELGPWGEPKDMEVTPDGPMPKLGDPARSNVLFLMADGSVRRVSKSIDEKILRLIVDPADGDPIPTDW